MLHFFAAALPALLLAGAQDPTTPPSATQEPATQAAPQEPTQANASTTVTVGQNPETSTAAPGPEAAKAANDAAMREQAAAALHRAEKTGLCADSLSDVTPLVQHADLAIAQRAAWLLGEWKTKDGVEALSQALSHSEHADLRLQCAAALDRIRDDGATDALVRGLHDADISVRAFASQALARRKATGSDKQLIALIEREGGKEPKAAHKDVTAALIALVDIGNADAILPAAAAVRFASDETGEALAFLFQELSPKMGPDIEATALVASLGHCEPMLRRYAIQRLGELRNPTTARALEGRLATEDAALQPLIRVSLAQVRRDDVETGADLALRAKSNAIAIGRMVERQWSSMETGTRLSASAVAGVITIGLMLILLARRRARRAEAAREAIALIGPSRHTGQQGRPEIRATPRFQQPNTDRTPVGSGRY